MNQKVNNPSSGAVGGVGRCVSKIRASKVVVGGIITGILLAAADFVSQNYLLGDEWQLVSQRVNLDLELIGGTGLLPLLHMTAANILIGLLILTTYAGIRPRFGAGPATAAIASFLIFLPCAVILAGFGGWLIHWDLFFLQALVMFVTFIAAGWAGAWIYSEEEQE